MKSGPRQLDWAWVAGSLALLIGPTMLTGCGGRGYDGPPRASVTGTVTLGGEPVDGGVIQFVPTSGDGRKASASILGGRYEIPEPRGPNPGLHRVMINWPKPTGRMGPDGESVETAEVVPDEYYANSTLEVELKAGRNAHDFEL